MGAKYERAYHSYCDSVNSCIFQLAENWRWREQPAALPRKRHRAQFVTGERKKTVRKANANFGQVTFIVKFHFMLSFKRWKCANGTIQRSHSRSTPCVSSSWCKTWICRAMIKLTFWLLVLAVLRATAVALEATSVYQFLEWMHDITIMCNDPVKSQIVVNKLEKNKMKCNDSSTRSGDSRLLRVYTVCIARSKDTYVQIALNSRAKNRIKQFHPRQLQLRLQPSKQLLQPSKQFFQPS